MFGIKKGERGFTLIEILIALVVLAVIATAFLYALAASSKSASLSDERTSAESLARTELEYVKNSVYIIAPWQYQLPGTPPTWDLVHTLPTSPSDYSGYTVRVTSALVHATDDGLQLITVVVSHGGSTIYTLSSYKAQK